jgi:hypothetical protein
MTQHWENRGFTEEQREIQTYLSVSDCREAISAFLLAERKRAKISTSAKCLVHRRPQLFRGDGQK